MAKLTSALQTIKSIFTFRIVVGMVILGGTCISLDRLLQLPVILSNHYYRAGVDSFTHGLIGLLSWAVVIEALPPRSFGQLLKIIFCGLLSSSLDVDHFVAAKSFYLQDALVLPFRPALHSTTLVIFISLFLLLAVHIIAPQKLQSLPYMFLTSSLSHHIRDASRRGLWLWPLGATPPLPYWTYIVLVCFLPIAIQFMLPLPVKQSTNAFSAQSTV